MREVCVVLVASLVSGFPLTVLAQQQAGYGLQPERPNILWLIAEDMGPDLGAYGTAGVQTPHLDRLARQGMLFENVFTASPVCSPSRSSLMTGMYPTTIGAHNHRSHRPDDPSEYPFPLPDSVRLVTDWLRHAGYFTANVVQFPPSIGFRGSGKTDWNFSYAGRPFDSHQWSDLKDNQPFYAQVNFSETHRGEAWERAQETLEQPANLDEVEPPPYYPDHPVVRREWSAYLNTVMALDRKVGRVLDLLEREGLEKSTVVVFLADHGRAMPRGKQWPYDSGLHVPLIIRWPEGMKAPPQYEGGTKVDRLISAIDLTATTLAMAGVQKPVAMQGRVFLGPDSGPPRLYVFGGRDRGDETVDRMRTARSRRFRYVRNYYPERPYLQRNRYKEANYPILWLMRKLHREGKLDEDEQRFMASERPEEELYDLRYDPHETTNRADSAAYQALLRQMRGTLDAWIKRTNDQGRFEEDPAVAEYYRRKAVQKHSGKIEEMSEKWGVPPYPELQKR